MTGSIASDASPPKFRLPHGFSCHVLSHKKDGVNARKAIAVWLKARDLSPVLPGPSARLLSATSGTRQLQCNRMRRIYVLQPGSGDDLLPGTCASLLMLSGRSVSMSNSMGTTASSRIRKPCRVSFSAVEQMTKNTRTSLFYLDYILLISLLVYSLSIL